MGWGIQLEPRAAKRLKTLAVLLVAVLALGGWFGWRQVSNIIRERQAAQARMAQALLALQQAEQAAATMARRQAEMLIADGGGAFEARQYQDAFEQFDRAVATDPTFADAYLSRGNARFALQQFEAAIGDYDLALARDPDLAQAYLARGTLHWTLARFDEAERDFKELTQRRPESAFFAGRYAVVLYDQGKKAEVRDFYERVLNEDRSRTWAAAGLLDAVATSEDDPKEGARAKLATAQQLWREGVTSIQVRHALGDGFFQAADYPSAIEWLGPLMQEDPNEVPTDVARDLAAAYKATGQVDACIDVWRKYLERMGRSSVFADEPVRKSCEGST